MPEWNPEIIDRLRSLWAEGVSTAEIGRRLHISKNAVVGKAHRLHLPPRPTPIRRGGTDGSNGVDRRAGTRRARPAPAGALLDIGAFATPVFGMGFTPSVAATLPRWTQRLTGGIAADRGSTTKIGKQTCCWPIGESFDPPFRFCSAGAVVGKPYCPEHCGIAYRPRRKRGDEDRISGLDVRSESPRAVVP